MNSNLSKGQEWQGLVLLKRRTQEPFTVICNAVPVYYLDRYEGVYWSSGNKDVGLHN